MSRDRNEVAGSDLPPRGKGINEPDRRADRDRLELIQREKPDGYRGRHVGPYRGRHEEGRG